MVKAEVAQIDAWMADISKEQIDQIKDNLWKLKNNLKMKIPGLMNIWVWLPKIKIEPIKDDEIKELNNKLKSDNVKISDLLTENDGKKWNNNGKSTPKGRDDNIPDWLRWV